MGDRERKDRRKEIKRQDIGRRCRKKRRKTDSGGGGEEYKKGGGGIIVTVLVLNETKKVNT